MSRIVVKVGSNVLTRADGMPDITMISSLVDQIAELREMGNEVILVSSGAVACGKRLIKNALVENEVDKRQLYSAMGQVRLIGLYFNLFRDHGIPMGQVLTMKGNFEEGRELENQRNCMEVMLRNGVVPVVNENDTVCVTELMFTDNDELSGLVARMMKADMLVLLTNVDGIYDGDPSDGKSEVIPVVHPGDSLEKYISARGSSLGRGGMQSKCTTAMSVASLGTRVVIACGRRENVLIDLVQRPDKVIHTEFATS